MIPKAPDSKKPFLISLIPKAHYSEVPLPVEGGVALRVMKLLLLLPLPKTPLAGHLVRVSQCATSPRAKTLGWKSGGLGPRHGFTALQLCGPGKLPEPRFPPLETNKRACLTRLLGLCNRTGSNKDFMNSMVKFLNPSTSDFLDQITVYCRGLSCASGWLAAPSAQLKQPKCL